MDSVVVADVDGQKGPDIVVLGFSGGGGEGQAIVNVLLNNGNGTFADPRPFVAATLAVTAYTPQFADKWADGYAPFGEAQSGTAVAVADVDNDGKLDVLLGGDQLIADYVPAYPISATPDHSFASIPYLYDMTTADFNGDGYIDIAALGDDDLNDDDVTVAIHAGKGDGTFAPFKRFVTRGNWSLDYIQVIASGDFDQDGLADLVTLGRTNKYASVLLNRSPLFANGFETGN